MHEPRFYQTPRAIQHIARHHHNSDPVKIEKLANKKKHVASKTCCIKTCRIKMFMIQLGCTKPPLVALHCQQHCVQHAFFCHTSKSILDTQRFRRLLCIQPCVWVETLEKVFRTKQPTLHAISSLFPLSPEPCGSESRCVLGGTPF